MTSAVKTAPKPAAPKGKGPAPKPVEAKTPANPAPKPEPTPEPAVKVVEVPSGYAAESVRNQLHAALGKLREEGWTRPMIRKYTDFTDSQVWRGQNLKVHTVELDRWFAFLKRVTDGEIKPDAPARKPKAEDLQPKIDAAVTALSGEAKTVAQYRAIVKAAVDALSA